MVTNVNIVKTESSINLESLLKTLIKIIRSIISNAHSAASLMTANTVH